MSGIKLMAFDLDGTLTQHKSPLGEQNRALLEALGARYHLLMVGAGQAQRIFSQMGGYPIDILGNYGMQYCRYDRRSGGLVTVFDERVPCDRARIEERVTMLREKYGYTRFAGDNVEYHASGCVTFPLLGTAAKLEEKLAFDPDRKKRAAFYDDVCGVFSDYTVFIGGSSSFDLAPFPYNKYYALDRYCAEHGLRHDEVVYVGDDYGVGGNDEAVYRSDFPFVCVDDHERVGACLRQFL